MKKIYLLAASFMMAVMSFGQHDLQLTLSTPTNGSSVPPSANQPISFTITNNGPDAFLAGDSLFVYYVNQTQGTVFTLTGIQGSVSYFPLPQNVSAGAIIPSAALGVSTLNTTAAGFNDGDVILVFAEISSAFLPQNTDPIINNNYGSFTLNSGTVVTDPVYDLELALTTPVSQSTVPQSAAQAIEFTLTNNGPDAIPMGDTLVIYYYNQTQDEMYSLDGVAGSATIFPLPLSVASGMSVSSAQLGVDPLNTLATGFNVGDIIFVIAEMMPDYDSSPLNNGDFFILGPTASVENTIGKHFSVFPNPATDVLNISSSEEVANVSVLSLDGKLVSTTNGKQVDVSKLKAGVYIYEVTTVSGEKVINKFMKK